MRASALACFLALISLQIGCSEKCTCPEPKPSSQEAIFALLLYKSYDYSSTPVPVIHAGFSTTDCSEVPSVTINNKKMDNIYLDNGSLEGEMILPYGTNVFNYSVSANKKTTSGSITMPPDLFNVVCNGVLLEACTPSACPGNYVPISGTLNFSWSCNGYDYFLLNLYAYGYLSCDTTLATNSTNVAMTFCNGADDYYFSLASVRGAWFKEGQKPNVSGNYGKGYVWAANPTQFTFHPNTGLIARDLLGESSAINASFNEHRKIARDFILAQ